jgi:hypothetical protein
MRWGRCGAWAHRTFSKVVTKGQRMIEITYIDLALLIWAALATSAYLSSKAELGMTKRLIRQLVENTEFRSEFFSGMDEVLKEKTQ